MSTSDRRPYLSATSLTQEVLDNSADNLTGKWEMIAEIETPNETLYLSDRSKFVGTTYYDNRINFPDIERTIGDWLAGVLEFSPLKLNIDNTDGEYNNIMPGGADYDGFIGSRITVMIGLAEISASYFTIFSGEVTDVGGFDRNRVTFGLEARSDNERVNVTIPQQVLRDSDFADIEDEFIGLSVPIIYGDWTVSLRPEGSMVPAFPVNGNDPLVNDDLGNPSAGDTDLKLVFSSTPIKSLDTATVTLLRGDEYHVFDASDITIIPLTDNTSFEITQKNLMIDGSPWIYSTGDEFFVRCVGVDLGAFTDNIVSQNRDILERFGGLTAPDFDSNWDTYRDKAAPAESSISTIKARAWIQEPIGAFEQVLSRFEEVRLEVFFSNDKKFKIRSLHFDDFEASPSFSVNNFDLIDDTLRPQIDRRNNFNRVKADFDFNPALGQNRLSTNYFRNQAAIDQAGRSITKIIVFPSLYIASDVENQLTEIVKLASGYSELISLVFIPRVLLQDIGNFVKVNFDLGAVVYEDIPAMIRSIGYNQDGSIPMTLWSYQLIDFPGYTPPTGSVGGSSATITQET